MQKWHIEKETLIYADVLDKGTKIGFVILMVTFSAYIFEILTPHVPIKDLPKYWGLPAHEYTKVLNISTGWSWVRMLGKGDFINFVGIAILASITIICFLAIIPVLFRKKDSVFLVFSLLEISVLLVALSGILRGSTH
jgi:hypothetical protein